MLEFIIFLMFLAFACIALVVYLINRAREQHKEEMRGTVVSDPGTTFTSSKFDLVRPPEREVARDPFEHLRRYEQPSENVKTTSPSTARQPGPCTLRIDYVDLYGVCTSRNVAPYRSGNTNEKFEAWCDLRKDRRTFYFERIHSATHINGGARMSRADVFRHIHPDRRLPPDLM